jgi:cytochrome c oxidase subunit 4
MSERAMPERTTSERNKPEHEHILPVSLYVTIWITLMVLTVVTAGVSFINLGPLNTVVALSIASFKAILVVLFFMHVKYMSDRLTKMVVVAVIFWLFLLLGLSLMDYGTRHFT